MNTSHIDIETFEVVFPVPAHIACGLNSRDEMASLSLQEILFRIRKFYEGKKVFLS